MLTRRMRAAAIGAIAVVALTTACSNTDSGGGGGEGGNVDLMLWMPSQEGTQKESLEAMISDFEESHPDITVTVEERQTDPHKDALRQIVGTDAGPDIYWYWEGLGLGGELVDVGLSHDLTEYYEEYGWEDRFTNPALAGVTQYGGYHGVPFGQQAMALYYNKDLFEEAGITEEPETYEELVAAADDLAAAGITPIEFGGTVNWHVMRLLDSLLETACGAETHTALSTGEASWAEESCVDEAFTELKMWGDEYFNEGYLGINNEDASQLFFSGTAAMAFEGTWFDSQVVDNGMDVDRVGIVKFPTETGRLYGFGEALYINAASEKKDAAAEFIDFVTSEETQEQTAGAWGAISVNKNVEPGTENPLNQLWVPIFDSAEGVYGPADQNLPLAVTTEYWRIQNSVLLGDIDPAEAGDELQRFIDNQ